MTRALALACSLAWLSACGARHSTYIDRRTDGRYGYPRSDDLHITTHEDAGPRHHGTIAEEHNDSSLPQAAPADPEDERTTP